MSDLNFDKAAKMNITAWEGDSFSFKITLKDENDQVINVQGYGFKMEVWKRDYTENVFTLPGIIAIDNSVSFIKTAADFSYTPGGYNYRVQRTNTDGKVKTIIAGILNIK